MAPNNPRQFPVKSMHVLLPFIIGIVGCSNPEMASSITPGDYIIVTTAHSTGLNSVDTININAVGDSVFLSGFEIHGHLSNDSLRIPLQLKEIPFKEDWRIQGGFRLVGPDSLYGTLNFVQANNIEQISVQMLALTTRPIL
jgi:hypothetical protein